MGKFILLSLLFLGCHLHGQELIWENSMGGDGNDWFNHGFQNQEGSYVFSGYSGSAPSDDKPEPSRGEIDMWIVETDLDGNILWQKIIGGNSGDMIMKTLELGNREYLLAGESISPVSGEKTDPEFNSRDMWLVKLDENQEIEWQQVYGGVLNDELEDIIRTRDGGYIVIGSSPSPISGNKTAPNRGGSDLWVLKLDSQGELEWQETYGGQAHDSFGKILETNNGYVIGGHSYSSNSGNKTVVARQGDYWLFEIDSDGDILWQRSIGGDSPETFTDLIPASDGGYILAGDSFSGATGDKNLPLKGSQYDLWVVKTDEQGDIQWQNSYGTDTAAKMVDITPSADLGYLIAAVSGSGVGNDKTEPNRGSRDYWLLKITQEGELCWEKTLGGYDADNPRSGFEDEEGNFVVAGWTESGATGEKLEPSLGRHDTWVVKISQPEVTEPVVPEIDPIMACDRSGDGITEFDLSGLHEEILGGQEDVTVSYFDEEWNPLPSPLPDTFTNTVKDRQVINVRLENTKVRCVGAEFQIILEVGCDDEPRRPLPGFPKYFTPNRDGQNDVWKVEQNLVELLDYIYIFDRYGKLLKELRPHQSWDGTFLGNPMPSDDYWYKAVLPDGFEVTGHFSLIR